MAILQTVCSSLVGSEMNVSRFNGNNRDRIPQANSSNSKQTCPVFFYYYDMTKPVAISHVLTWLVSQKKVKKKLANEF